MTSDPGTVTVTDPTDLHDLLVRFLGCAVEDRQAFYVSAPITTGRRFIEWRRGPGAALREGTNEYRYQHRIVVIEPNLQAVAPIVRELRHRHDGVVIDPTALDNVPGWDQDDYHRFWEDVIEHYVKTVAFADGWEFSTGCVHELATALRVRAQLLDQELRTLTVTEAKARVCAAIEEVSDWVLPAEPLRHALDELMQVERLHMEK